MKKLIIPAIVGLASGLTTYFLLKTFNKPFEGLNTPSESAELKED